MYKFYLLIQTNIGDVMKKILYTGARSGIASKVIEKFLNSDKYLIYLTVETNAQLKEVAKIYQNYENIKYFKLDLTNDKDLDTIKKLDVDILVSNAAVGYGGSIAEIDIDKIRENYEVNVFQNFKLVQIVLEKMIKKNKGRIIMMSSLASILPIPFLGSYSSTKASINKLTETLKLELKYINSNIDIVLIEPGLYHTGFNQVMLENKYDDMKDSYFKEELEFIRKSEEIFFNLLEHENYKSVVNVIYKAITSNNPKFIYKAPFFQGLFSKLYQIFFQ